MEILAAIMLNFWLILGICIILFVVCVSLLIGLGVNETRKEIKRIDQEISESSEKG